MPHPSPPPERTLLSRATRKRKAAARREAEAVRLRTEADDLDRQWGEFKSAEAARRQAAANVAGTVAS